MGRLALVLLVAMLLNLQAGALSAEQQAMLPDSPGSLPAVQAKGPQTPAETPCPVPGQAAAPPEAASAAEARSPCPKPAAPRYGRFVDSGMPSPLSARQKGILALHDIIDPFNLLTILGNSAFTVGLDSHTAYGPGFEGFGRNVGYSFSQDVTGEFIGTFAVCALLHEDPRYHRLPHGTPMRRIVHAIARTAIAQHDDGRRMPNYENFITYPVTAEISNLYVPGVNGNAPSTAERILTGLATDPINNLITEFLPDLARRVHIRIVFVQQILNQITSEERF